MTQKSDALSIQYVDPRSLKEHPNNARKHPDAQIEQIRASYRAFGFKGVILVEKDGKTIVAGAGRTKAAVLEGIEQVPVVNTGLEGEEAAALRLADNQIALNSEWDLDTLSNEIRRITEGGSFTQDVLGFDPSFVAGLLNPGTTGTGDPDQVPEAPKKATSQLGDTWLLGDHRLRCGDSTSAEAVKALLADLKPNLMVTDPPYGVEYDPAWRNKAGASISNRTGKVMNDHRADWREVWAMFEGNAAYVWHGALHAGVVEASLLSCGFEIRSQIIWNKDRLVLSRGDYHWNHEPCFYAVRKGKPGGWTGDRKQKTVWDISTNTASNRKNDEATIHGTQKPVECMKRPMLNNSKTGDYIYEPFCGSGSTIIAAETCGRRVVAMELDPLYVDVAVMRWQKFTGKDAVLEGTDRTFDDIAENGRKKPRAKAKAK